MYVDSPVGRSSMPYSRRQHYLSTVTLYRLTDPFVSAITSAHSHPVLTSPLPTNWDMLFGSLNMRAVSCLQVACSMQM